MNKKILGIFFVALLAVLVFAGWSCGNGYAVSNNNEPETGSQAQTYRNDEWGVSFTYPAGWQYREYRETVDGQEVTTLAFSDQELPETMPPEPLFPVMVSRDSRTVEEVAAIHTDAVSTEDRSMGGRMAKVITRYSDILEQNYPIYLVPLRTGSIRFLSLDVRYTVVAEGMVNTLTETE